MTALLFSHKVYGGTRPGSLTFIDLKPFLWFIKLHFDPCWVTFIWFSVHRVGQCSRKQRTKWDRSLFQIFWKAQNEKQRVRRRVKSMVRFGSMSYSDQTPPSPSRTSGSNSGAQYATAALGVGLIALGIVMIVWSVVPAGSGGNSSRPGMDSSQVRETSSVAFVLVGGGVALLLLSVCLSIRNKHRAARGQDAGSTPADAQEEGATWVHTVKYTPRWYHIHSLYDDIWGHFIYIFFKFYSSINNAFYT